MQELCDLTVHVDEQHTFLLHQVFLNRDILWCHSFLSFSSGNLSLLSQRVLCSFSGKLKEMVSRERKRSQPKGSGVGIMEFPGGACGFELVSRFCYNNGSIAMTPSNICLLHCSAILLEMTEEVSSCNLLRQTETFLDGVFHWTWNDILTALKSCEPFFPIADSCGLLQKLVSSLLAKIAANSEMPLLSATPFPSSSSSSSSPDASGFRCSSSTKTPEPMKPCSNREWWFDDLTILAPTTVEKIMKTLGAYGTDNKNLVLTRFLLHYLKTVVQRPCSGVGCGNLGHCKEEYGGLADTAVHGVALMGRTTFSCRGLFWVLRVVSGLGLSKECRQKLERLMGLVLDQATLDDLLVSGHDGGVYDVNLVLRLVRIFVSTEEGGDGSSSRRMKKVGRLTDKYLGEISPDQSLKVSKFLEVAESLPDSARDCFDGVYRALDIYLELVLWQSHPTLSAEERTRLCGCLNYEKLTLEACKDLAKNPRVPPGAAVQALVSQHSKLHLGTDVAHPSRTPAASPESPHEKEQLKLSLQRIQCRVKELEKACRNMKGQMSKMVKTKSLTHSNRGMPRLC
ncbi:hypothetical protein BHE74_00017425 [Ensete ventricosum]|nr:hypothetical protein BHE74_00017425 [Ensete ventricosum]